MNNMQIDKLMLILLCLLSILLVALISGCSMTVLPRDEIEVYERGLSFWEDGHYEMAIKILTPFTEKDSLYAPLYTILADCYYRLDKQETALYMLLKAAEIRDSGIFDNLLYSLKAQDNRVFRQEERVSFSQYITDIAGRFALDKELLLAFIEAGSSFNMEGDGTNEAVGIMGLSIDQAINIGLKVPGQKTIEEIDLYEFDERFDPAKSIYHSARYLSALIEKNRFGNKNTDLIAALRAFFKEEKDRDIPKQYHSEIDLLDSQINTEQDSGYTEVPVLSPEEYQVSKKQTKKYDDVRVAEIIDNYRSLRHNQLNIRRAINRFHEQNKLLNTPFNTEYKHVSDYHNHQELKQYKEKRLQIPLYLPKYNHQAYYYNNIALICEMLSDNENAIIYFEKALRILPDDRTILFNYALFHFEQDNFSQAYELLNRLDEEDDSYPQAVVVKGYCLLLLGERDKLAELLAVNKFAKPHYFNLQGLDYFQRGNIPAAIESFRKAFNISHEPVFAANFLAAKYQYYFPETASTQITKLNKITRNYDTGFIWPLDLRFIISGYGWRPNPFYRNWEKRLKSLDFHNGLDIPGPTGSPVSAAAAGEVILSQRYPLGGETVFIKHEDEYITTYLHLDKRLVEEGEKVQQGQVIGLLGSTGQSTGPHLHFGMFNNQNQPTNPLNYLPHY